MTPPPHRSSLRVNDAAAGGGATPAPVKRPVVSLGLGNFRESQHAFGPLELREESKFRIASPRDVLRAHSERYFRLVCSLARHVHTHGDPVPYTPILQRGVGRLPLPLLKAADACDTSFSAGSLKAALRAAGAVVAGVDAVVRGTARNCLAVVRPPGHHAGREGLIEHKVDKPGETHHQSCGFCIFNKYVLFLSPLAFEGTF